MPARALMAAPHVQEYLDQLRHRLAHLPSAELEEVTARVLAEIELELDLRHAEPSDPEAVEAVLGSLGTPEAMAARIEDRRRVESPATTDEALVQCRVCGKPVSRAAHACPACGAPFPGQAQWTGYGYEWKSKAEFHRLPLIHVAWGRDQNGRRRVARGIIAIGQFGVGVITIAQFGIGVIFGLGQFVLAPIAIGQFALGLVAVGQIGIGILAGLGQLATGLFAAGMKAFGLWTRSSL